MQANFNVCSLNFNLLLFFSKSNSTKSNLSLNFAIYGIYKTTVILTLCDNKFLFITIVSRCLLLAFLGRKRRSWVRSDANVFCVLVSYLRLKAIMCTIQNRSFKYKMNSILDLKEFKPRLLNDYCMLHTRLLHAQYTCTLATRHHRDFQTTSAHMQCIYVNIIVISYSNLNYQKSRTRSLAWGVRTNRPHGHVGTVPLQTSMVVPVPLLMCGRYTYNTLIRDTIYQNLRTAR